MIITRKWLQESIDISKISTQTICAALNSLGLEVDSTERILIPNGVVIGKVEACEKHPDADKLNVCQVNIGTKVEQIVCGAKNVAEGQIVPVATIGAVLGEDFKIKKAKLRGVESNGMICSSTEIGLPKMNDGIMELDDSIGELIIGKELNEYPLLNDEIIEIELTANRGDCLSIHGIARELGTYFNLPINNFDIINNSNNMGIGQIFDVHYDTQCESSLIYKAINLEKFSLKLLQSVRAAFIEQLKQNDIQTAIAYVTHETGVLLNGYSRLSSSNQDEKIATLKIQKDKNGFDTVTGKELLSTIGIDAGAIENPSEDIILEASYTNPETLAQRVFDKTKSTGEIYYRASRGSEPDLTFGIDRITSLFSSCGATIYNGSKNFLNDIEQVIIHLNMEQLNAIVGQEIEMNKVIQILSSLGFGVKQNDHNSISVNVPYFRHDIKNVADVTEEIVRVIGIDNIKSKPLLMQELNNNNETSKRLILQNEIRSRAINQDFFETITYAFTNKELLEKYNFDTVYKKYDILNPIVNELNTFRTTFALNLIQAVSHNVKLGFKKIAIFESGTIFDKSRHEEKAFGFIFSGEQSNPSLKNHGKPESINLFEFAEKLSTIFGDFSLQPMKKITNDTIHPYQNGDIILDGKTIGHIYKLHPTVADDFDISKETFLAEIKMEELLQETTFATTISKFQSSRRDLSIVVPKTLEYKNIKKAIDALKIEEIKQYNLIDIYSDESLGENESLTINFILQSNEKTFTEDDINEIMDKVINKLNDDLGVELR
jgi:phenylalanyl-tRNA synthetase beta chain